GRCSKRPAFHVAKQSISAIKSPIWRRRVRKTSLLEPCPGATEQLNLLENISLRKNSIVFPPSEESPSLVPNFNEPLNRPSHQLGDLSVAYLDDALNAVRTARHVHTKERAWNHVREKYDWFRDGRARLSGIRRSVQDEVSPLGACDKILDAPDAKTCAW